VLVRALCDEWRVRDRLHQFILGSAVLGFCPVVSAVRQGQPSILLAVAVLGLYRAAKAAHHWTGGAWLVVLTIKPQLVPIVVIYLAARRNWRLLGCASAMLAIAVAITAVALGPTIWFDYVHQVRVLEHFWGNGTPDQMLNVRGALTRMIGLDEHVRIDAVSGAVWFAAMVLVGAMLVRRRIDKAHDARPAYAFVIAVALLSNPHLFIHDAVIWTVPLVLYTAAICDAGGAWRPFAQFALSWPLVFAVAGSLDIRSGGLTWLDPYTWVLVAATVIIGCRWPSTDERQTVSHRASLRLDRAPGGGDVGYGV
jgi:Glycosyltransferase family 87